MVQLKNYLDAQGINQSEFARRMNVTKACVSLWISRKNMPRPEPMYKIKIITEGAVTPDDWLKAFEVQCEEDDC